MGVADSGADTLPQGGASVNVRRTWPFAVRLRPRGWETEEAPPRQSKKGWEPPPSGVTARHKSNLYPFSGKIIA